MQVSCLQTNGSQNQPDRYGCPESRQCPVFDEDHHQSEDPVRVLEVYVPKTSLIVQTVPVEKKIQIIEKKNPLAKTAVCIWMNINDSYRYT